MTTINATINGESAWGNAAKRIDIWHEGGGVGRWELLVDNISGASQLAEVDHEATDLGINGAVLMKGYVDDILPDVKDASAVFSKYAQIKGRNYGRDLVAKFIIKNYSNWKFDDLVEDALTLAGSEITFSSSGVAPEVDADFNKTFLQHGFVDIAQRLGYDFLVNDAKQFQMWSLAGAPSSGVVLKAVADDPNNNILLIEATKMGVDRRNYIRVDAGSLNDHWSEGNAIDWTVTESPENGGSVANDTTTYLVNAASLKVTSGNTALWTRATLEFPQYNHDYLAFDVVGSEQCRVFVQHDSLYNAAVRIYLTDDEGNEIVWMHGDGAWAPGAKWNQIDFPVGIDSPVTANWVAQTWCYSVGSSFTWRVKKVAVQVHWQAMAVNHFWVDGLKMPVDVFAIAEDVEE